MTMYRTEIEIPSKGYSQVEGVKGIQEDLHFGTGEMARMSVCLFIFNFFKVLFI